MRPIVSEKPVAETCAKLDAVSALEVIGMVPNPKGGVVPGEVQFTRDLSGVRQAVVRAALLGVTPVSNGPARTFYRFSGKRAAGCL
jgi:hypothetical protein